MTTVASPNPAWRGDLVAVALVVAWLLVVRAALECPWGFAPVATPTGLRLGIPFNVGDTWSYLSWINQYRENHFAASLLYTTDPHPALLWIFPLWAIGRVAAWTGAPVLGIYWTLGVGGAAGAVYFFRRAARALGFDRSACDWSTLIFAAGSGASWVWHFAHRLGLARPAEGGEFRYHDLFPSTAFILYPYHALSFALLAALWWAVAGSENRLVQNHDARAPLAATATLALLLSFSRPYEPLAFGAAYGLKTIWTFCARHPDPHAWRASRVTLLVLGLALSPGLIWNAWVSLQPVWSAFAGRSLAQGLDRVGWFSALAGWGALSAVGAVSALRLPRARGALPIAAALLAAAVLLGLAHAQTKLASGLFLGLALLAGAGAASAIRWLRARWPAAIVVAAGAVAVGGLLGAPSLALVLLSFRLSPQATVDPDLYRAASDLPSAVAGHATVVLADPDVGLLLPGLRGLRVYAGHFSLTNAFEAKKDRLQRAGFDPASPAPDGATARAALHDLLTTARPDFALLDARCIVAIAELRRLGWRSAAAPSRWVTLRAPLSPSENPSVN